jgi:hypothetical protein
LQVAFEKFTTSGLGGVGCFVVRCERLAAKQVKEES